MFLQIQKTSKTFGSSQYCFTHGTFVGFENARKVRQVCFFAACYRQWLGLILHTLQKVLILQKLWIVFQITIMLALALQRIAVQVYFNHKCLQSKHKIYLESFFTRQHQRNSVFKGCISVQTKESLICARLQISILTWSQTLHKNEIN